MFIGQILHNMQMTPLSSIKKRDTAIVAWNVRTTFQISNEEFKYFQVPIYSAAQWMGVVPEKSLDVGLQCFSKVRNFAMSECPLHAA